jgi:1,2-diacylglycerol 3-alpha-glucosyltransferase
MRNVHSKGRIRTMIIGEFCDVFPPETDGVGMVVKSYAEELTRMKHCCYYVSPKIPNYNAVQSFPTFQYFSIGLNGSTYRAGIPQLDIPFRNKIKKVDFDIIHAHSPFSAGREAMRIAKKKSIPLVGTFHTKYYDDFYKATHSKLISKTCVKYVLDFYNSCDEVWAVSNSTADVLREYGFKKDIKIMPNGTNLWYPTEEDIKKVSEKYGLDDEHVFLFVGQQNWKKNIRNIIKAIKVFSKNNKDFKMVFAGKGPDEDEIKELVKTLCLQKKVIFTGHIMDRNLLMSLYARADLLVFPSPYDNAPMVVRESAAAGTPSILLKDSCSAEGITHGYNGFLCENTPKSIANCIAEALPSAKQVGEKARQTIPLPWSSVMENAFSRYRELVAK